MTVLLFSGGLDSTVLLHDLHFGGDQVACLTFNYGQRHGREAVYAMRLTHRLGVFHELIVLPAECFVGSSITGGSDSLVVPNRNMVFVALAAAWAVGHGHTAVAIAATADDYETWPDCRPEFFDKLGDLLRDVHGILLLHPYSRKRKAEVVALGREMVVPLDETWSCYLGADEPCGTCPACTTRAEALACS